MRLLRLCAVAAIAILLLYMGIDGVSNGITAKNANEVDYNNMTQEEMGQYCRITGELEYVLGCFAEGYTERSTFGVVTSETTDSYYYLVECPYSVDNTYMILEAGANTELDEDINVLANETYYDFNLEHFTVPFTGYLEKNDSEIVDYAKEALTYNGYTDFKIAPYTINCRMASGFAERSLYSGIVFLVFFVILVVAVVLFLKKSVGTPAYYVSGSSGGIGNGVGGGYGSASPSRVEDYYGEIYHSNMTEADNNDK